MSSTESCPEIFGQHQTFLFGHPDADNKKYPGKDVDPESCVDSNSFAGELRYCSAHNRARKAYGKAYQNKNNSRSEPCAKSGLVMQEFIQPDFHLRMLEQVLVVRQQKFEFK